MDTYRAPARSVKPDHAAADADDSDELGVFAAERYFYGADDDDDALWPWPCERSSSSLSSAFRTGTATGTHDDPSVPTPTAATSSSEASWNSRSALLPTIEPPADKLHLHDVAAGPAAATLCIEAMRSGAELAGGQRASTRPPASSSSSSSSSNLRRWLLLGVAACGCAGGISEEESVISADEMEETEIPKATATASVAPGSARWLLESDKPPVAAGIGMDGRHRRASATNFHYREAGAAATSHSDERRRIKSLEMFRPVPVPVPVVVGDHEAGTALGSAATQQQSRSAFTIVAGNTALGFAGDAPAPAPAPASGGGGGTGRGGPAGNDDDDDVAAGSELGCAAAYAPSEASVVWSVVTADGAASAGNFSSAASGYYYRYYLNNDADDGAMRRATAAAKSSRSKRRSGIASGGSGLLTCISDRAVDAVGPAPPPSVHRRQQELQPATVRGNNAGRFCGQPEWP